MKWHVYIRGQLRGEIAHATLDDLRLALVGYRWQVRYPNIIDIEGEL